MWLTESERRELDRRTSDIDSLLGGEGLSCGSVHQVRLSRELGSTPMGWDEIVGKHVLIGMTYVDNNDGGAPPGTEARLDCPSGRRGRLHSPFRHSR